jgi:mono/diheme cytochrome c family protein
MRVVINNTRIFAVLLPFVVLIGGYTWTSARVIPQETSVKKASLTAEQLARARTIFNGKCARCHGTDGQGDTVLGNMLEVPDFTKGSWWSEHGNTDELVDTIKNGSGDMPAFGKKLTKPEISLLADYVRHFNKDEH